MPDSFSHIDDQNRPKMVNVGTKKETLRTATAHCSMYLGREIVAQLKKKDNQTKKGPVFHTAIIAGIQAVKKTSDLIPMCHPLAINGVDIQIEFSDDESIELFCTVHTEGKTGVEMEALTGVGAAALTVYDMCKALSQKMVIREIKLIMKTGGKSDYEIETNE